MNLEGSAAPSADNEGEKKQANYEANAARAAEVQKEIAEAAASGDFAKIAELSAEGAKLMAENQGVESADRDEADVMNAEFDAEKARAEEEAAKKAAEEAATQAEQLKVDAQRDKEESMETAEMISARIQGVDGSLLKAAPENYDPEMDLIQGEAEREAMTGWSGERAKASIEAEREFLSANLAALKSEFGEEAVTNIVDSFKQRKFNIGTLGTPYLPNEGLQEQIAVLRRKAKDDLEERSARKLYSEVAKEITTENAAALEAKENQRAEWSDPTIQMEADQSASDAEAKIIAGLDGADALSKIDEERRYLNANRQALLKEFGEEAVENLIASFRERNNSVKYGGRYYPKEGLMAQVADLRQEASAKRLYRETVRELKEKEGSRETV